MGKNVQSLDRMYIPASTNLGIVHTIGHFDKVSIPWDVSATTWPLLNGNKWQYVEYCRYVAKNHQRTTNNLELACAMFPEEF